MKNLCCFKRSTPLPLCQSACLGMPIRWWSLLLGCSNIDRIIVRFFEHSRESAEPNKKKLSKHWKTSHSHYLLHGICNCIEYNQRSKARPISTKRDPSHDIPSDSMYVHCECLPLTSSASCPNLWITSAVPATIMHVREHGSFECHSSYVLWLAGCHDPDLDFILHTSPELTDGYFYRSRGPQTLLLEHLQI